MFRVVTIASAAIMSMNIALAAMSERPDMLSDLSAATSADAITSQLEALGYTNVSNASLNGDIYRAQAEWEGQPISLLIDRSLGAISDAGSPDLEVVAVQPGMDAEGFAAALVDKGYSNVRNIVMEGNAYRATADRNGRGHSLKVDAQTGVVTSLSERTGLAIAPTEGMSKDDIIRQLEGIGIGDPQLEALHGEKIAATGMLDGKRVRMNIETQTGLITVLN